MSEIPFAISKYLGKILYPDRAYAYLQLNDSHCVISSGGCLEKCGVPSFEPDTPIENQIDLLTGVLPINGMPVAIPNIELSDQILVDMHLFSFDNSQWVLLLDNTAAKPKLQSEQQARLSEKLSLESNKIDRS